MRKQIPVLACTLLLALPACTGTEGDSAAPATTSAPAVPSVASPTAAPTGVQSSAPPASVSPDATTRTSKGFGQTTTFADQSDIRIEAPTSGTVAGKDAALMKVTVSNRSGEEAPMQFWFFEASVDGKPVALLEDAAQGIGLPQEMLGAGRSRSFTIACPWKQGQKLNVKVNWRDSHAFTYGG